MNNYITYQNVYKLIFQIFFLFSFTFAQDPVCSRQRTDYATGLMTDIVAKDYLTEAKKILGVNAFNKFF